MHENLNKRWTRVVSAIIFVLFIIIGTGFVLNTSMLRQEVSREAEAHTLNVNTRQARNFSYRMEIDLRFIVGFSDSIGRMYREQVTEAMLKSKQEAYGLEQIAILGSDGSVFPKNADTKNLFEWSKDHSEIWKVPGIHACEERGILFSSPIAREDEQISYIVIAAKSYEKLQELSVQEHHANCMTNLLVDAEGNILSSHIGDEMADTIAEKSDLDMLMAKMKESGQQPGECHIFELENGKEILVSMHDLDINDWVQVSILPWTSSNAFAKHLKIYLLLCTVFVVISGIMIVFIMILQSQTKKKWDEVFFHDFVTGGITNKAFQIQGAELLHHEDGKPYVIMYLDIRDFEHINEVWGFESGNETLRYVHDCFRRNITNDELVARSEADHFFFLLHSGTEDELQKRVDHMIREINIFNERYKEQHTLDFAVGAYFIDNPHERMQVLQDRARRAAKFHDLFNICTFYDDRVIGKINRENRLNAMFQKSLENHEFQVYLQPKVYLQQDKPCAAEALIRWIHPDEGVIYPSEFISLFEENGKICELDLYMFREVCKLIDKWRKNGRALTEISVNISRANLNKAHMNFHKKYCEIKREYDIPDGVIQLELTETTMLYAQQFPYVAQIIDDFRNAGFLCALDDFGFGYSSLSLLKEFCVDTIKLDRSFFVNENPKSRIVVANMIRLAHDMNIQIVAEGIEEEQQVESLCELGCDLIQGYFFSKPLPIEQFEIWQDREMGVTT